MKDYIQDSQTGTNSMVGGTENERAKIVNNFADAKLGRNYNCLDGRYNTDLQSSIASDG